MRNLENLDISSFFVRQVMYFLYFGHQYNQIYVKIKDMDPWFYFEIQIKYLNVYYKSIIIINICFIVN